MKLVIVGYGPGGVAAATAARAFDRDAEILLITDETIQAHRKPGSSLALEFPDSEKLFIADWSYDALRKKRIEVSPGVRVISADTDGRTLQTIDSNGTSSTISYDKLVLATGGVPAVPEMPGVDLPGVHTIQTMVDASRIGETLREAEAVIIVGAGFSGLETADRLREMGKDVHLIVRSRLMRRLLEEPMSDELESRIPPGVILHKGSSPERVIGADRVKGLIVGGEEMLADAVLFMTGVSPNTELAKTFGLKIGSLGGIVVDPTMKTSADGIYAVGDCVELTDRLAGKPMLLPVGSAAARAGRQAGVTAVGGKKVYSDTALKLQYDRIFNTDIVCIGHSSTTASGAGVETKIHYLDDPAEFAKIALVTTKDGRLIGGQVLSARMGAPIAYQILERIESGAKLSEKPLLKPRHERIKDLLENMLGPIG
ncbi:MAG: NAD(P)/FAD-dependent oxidoreductase [Candidatus Thorarchaeota archaeon]